MHSDDDDDERLETGFRSESTLSASNAGGPIVDAAAAAAAARGVELHSKRRGDLIAVFFRMRVALKGKKVRIKWRILHRHPLLTTTTTNFT